MPQSGHEGSGRARPDAVPRLQPVPASFVSDTGEGNLPIGDLDDAARAYVELRGAELRTALAAPDASSAHRDAVGVLDEIRSDLFARLADPSQSADLITGALRLLCLFTPAQAVHLDSVGEPARATEMALPLVWAVALLGGQDRAAQLAVYLADYASQEYELEAMQEVEDIARGLWPEPADEYAPVGDLIQASRRYRLGDVGTAATIAGKYCESETPWVREYAQLLLRNAERVLDDLPVDDQLESESTLARFRAARLQGDRVTLKRLLPAMVEMGSHRSPIDRASASGELALCLLDENIVEAGRHALLAADAVDDAVRSLDLPDKTALLSILAQPQESVLRVLMRVSKLGVESVDVAAYDWCRRLRDDRDLPPHVGELSLTGLVELHAGLSGQVPPLLATDRATAYDFFFLSASRSMAGGWRFVFEPDSPLMMEPFFLSDAGRRALLNWGSTSGVTRADILSLVRELLGPWPQRRVECGFDHPAIEIRANSLFSELDLEFSVGELEGLDVKSISYGASDLS